MSVPVEQDLQRLKRVTQIGKLEPYRPNVQPYNQLEHGESRAVRAVGQIDPKSKNGIEEYDNFPKDGTHRKIYKRLNLAGSNTYRGTKATKFIKSPQAFVKRKYSPSVQYTVSPVQFELGGMVTVAVTKTQPIKCIHLRQYPLRDADRVLHWCQRFRHANIVTAIESYMARGACVVAYEEMFASLDMLVRSLAYPSNEQIGTILRQILDALSYVDKLGFQFASLDSGSILLNLDGDVKIMSLAYKQKGESMTSCMDILRHLDSIILQLMYKSPSAYPMEALQERLATTSDLTSFRARLKTARSITELLEHPIVQGQPKKDNLQWLVRLALACDPPNYIYKS